MVKTQHIKSKVKFNAETIQKQTSKTSYPDKFRTADMNSLVYSFLFHELEYLTWAVENKVPTNLIKKLHKAKLSEAAISFKIKQKTVILFVKSSAIHENASVDSECCVRYKIKKNTHRVASS